MTGKKGIEKEGTLNDSQHGFHKQRSCETQLEATVNNFAQSHNQSEQIDYVLF